VEDLADISELEVTCFEQKDLYIHHPICLPRFILLFDT